MINGILMVISFRKTLQDVFKKCFLPEFDMLKNGSSRIPAWVPGIPAWIPGIPARIVFLENWKIARIQFEDFNISCFVLASTSGNLGLQKATGSGEFRIAICFFSHGWNTNR